MAILSLKMGANVHKLQLLKEDWLQLTGSGRLPDLVPFIEERILEKCAI
jgi:hypothetical protein